MGPERKGEKRERKEERGKKERKKGGRDRVKEGEKEGRREGGGRNKRKNNEKKWGRKQMTGETEGLCREKARGRWTPSRREVEFLGCLNGHCRLKVSITPAQ